MGLAGAFFFFLNLSLAVLLSFDFSLRNNIFFLKAQKMLMFFHMYQACTEMVMPMATSNNSMFPASNYNYTANEEWCLENYHVKPRPTWITTEFGGHVWKLCLKFVNFLSA